jgi:hypothetical protein
MTRICFRSGALVFLGILEISGQQKSWDNGSFE